jgi:type I restriction-modification system DNA methylase subunit
MNKIKTATKHFFLDDVVEKEVKKNKEYNNFYSDRIEEITLEIEENKRRIEKIMQSFTKQVVAKESENSNEWLVKAIYSLSSSIKILADLLERRG